jgi:hypothetical protein
VGACVASGASVASEVVGAVVEAPSLVGFDAGALVGDDACGVEPQAANKGTSKQSNTTKRWIGVILMLCSFLGSSEMKIYP